MTQLSSKQMNMMDFAATIDMLNTFIRLGLSPFNSDDITDLQSQLDIIKYRSHEV